MKSQKCYVCSGGLQTIPDWMDIPTWIVDIPGWTKNLYCEGCKVIWEITKPIESIDVKLQWRDFIFPGATR
jgi:hypothetical protein